MRTKRYRLAKASNPKKVYATITFHGRSKKQAERNARKFSKRHNVEMGFVDASGFHPIRASKDYSASAAGEGRSRKAGKVRAKRSTRKARRGRQAIS